MLGKNLFVQPADGANVFYSMSRSFCCPHTPKKKNAFHWTMIILVIFFIIFRCSLKVMEHTFSTQNYVPKRALISFGTVFGLYASLATRYSHLSRRNIFFFTSCTRSGDFSSIPKYAIFRLRCCRRPIFVPKKLLDVSDGSILSTTSGRSKRGAEGAAEVILSPR